MKIAYNCKICKKPGFAELEETSTQEACDRLAPLLTCDPCFDLRQKLVKSTDAITRACFLVKRAEDCSIEKEAAAEIRGKCRLVLMAATRNYADVMRIYRKLDSIVWSEEFADGLMAHPENVKGQLKFYRDNLRRYVKHQSIQTFADKTATDLTNP